MADPLLTDIFKVQAVFKDNSNLPENQFINNWYFRNDEIAVPPFNAIKAVLDAFYFQPAANGQIIKAQMASHVVTAAEYRIYDLGQAPLHAPGEPLLAPDARQGNCEGFCHAILACRGVRGVKGPEGRPSGHHATHWSPSPGP
jgi:hypothetical protein